MVSPSMQAEADHPRVTEPQERARAQTLAQPPDARREVEHCEGRLNSITMYTVKSMRRPVGEHSFNLQGA